MKTKCTTIAAELKAAEKKMFALEAALNKYDRQTAKMMDALQAKRDV